MKTHNIRVTFDAEAEHYTDGPGDLNLRVWALKSDLFRAFRGKRIATLLDLDTNPDRVDLVVPSAGKVRRVLKQLNLCLAQNNFESADITVSEAHEE
jgi:hypothetical protein